MHSGVEHRKKQEEFAKKFNDLIVLRDRRVKADYFEDNVDLEEANQAHVIARELVQGLLAEETP